MPPTTPSVKGATMRSQRRPTSAATSLRSRIAETYVDMALGGIFSTTTNSEGGGHTTSTNPISMQGTDPFHVCEVAHVLQRVGRGHTDRVHLGCLKDELADSSGQQLPLASPSSPASAAAPLFPVSLRSYSKSPRSGVVLRSLASEVATRTWADASTSTPISWRPTFHHSNQPDGSVGAESHAPTKNMGDVDSTTSAIATSPIKSTTPGPSRPQSSSTQLMKSGGKGRTLPHTITTTITTPLRPLRLPDKMLDSPFRSAPFRVDTTASRHSSHYTNNSPTKSPSGKEGSIRATLAPPTGRARSTTKKSLKK